LKLKHERPLEYQRLEAENKLGEYMTKAQAPWITDAGIIFGFLTVLIGFILLVLILLGQFVY
jgi:hypothetical protein